MQQNTNEQGTGLMAGQDKRVTFSHLKTRRWGSDEYLIKMESDRAFLTVARGFFLINIVLVLVLFLWATFKKVSVGWTSTTLLKFIYGDTWEGWLAFGGLAFLLWGMATVARIVGGIVDSHVMLARHLSLDVRVESRLGLLFKVSAVVDGFFWLFIMHQWLHEFQGADCMGFIICFCLGACLWTGFSLFGFGCVFQLLEWSSRFSARAVKLLCETGMKVPCPSDRNQSREAGQENTGE
jgi:hypothetical protein